MKLVVGWDHTKTKEECWQWKPRKLILTISKKIIKIKKIKKLIITGKTEMNEVIETKRKDFQEGADNQKSFKKVILGKS